MIQRLIDLSLRHRAIVLVVYLALGVWGYWALRTASVDAIPDLSDHQVIVFTDWTGHSAQEVEDQVTYPLTVNLQGLPGVRVVRSQSAFGFSMIYVVFEDDVDLYFARTRVLERLEPRRAGCCRPASCRRSVRTRPASGTSSGTRSRARRDRCATCAACRTGSSAISSTRVPGVAEVASIGGGVQQYQIDVDPEPAARLRPHARRRRPRGHRQQQQRRRQRRGIERRVVDRARRRPDRVARRISSRSCSARRHGVPVLRAARSRP